MREQEDVARLHVRVNERAARRRVVLVGRRSRRARARCPRAPRAPRLKGAGSGRSRSPEAVERRCARREAAASRRSRSAPATRRRQRSRRARARAAARAPPSCGATSAPRASAASSRSAALRSSSTSTRFASSSAITLGQTSSTSCARAISNQRASQSRRSVGASYWGKRSSAGRACFSTKERARSPPTRTRRTQLMLPSPPGATAMGSPAAASPSARTYAGIPSSLSSRCAVTVAIPAKFRSSRPAARRNEPHAQVELGGETWQLRAPRCNAPRGFQFSAPRRSSVLRRSSAPRASLALQIVRFLARRDVAVARGLVAHLGAHCSRASCSRGDESPSGESTPRFSSTRLLLGRERRRALRTCPTRTRRPCRSRTPDLLADAHASTSRGRTWRRSRCRRRGLRRGTRARSVGIEGELEVLLPVERGAGLGQLVVAVARAGNAQRDVGRVRRDLVGDAALLHVVLLRQARGAPSASRSRACSRRDTRRRSRRCSW